MQGGLAAHLAAADDDDAVAQGVLLAQHVNGDLGLVHAGHRQDQGLGADGHDYRVKSLDGVGGGLGVQLHGDVALVHLGDEPVHVILHRILEGEVARHVEHTAQLPGGLEQGDLMTPLPSHQSGLHTGRAAAHHGNLLHPLHRLHQMGDGVLQPGGGVNGALEVMAVDGGVVAAHALDAGGHVLPTARHALLDQQGISDEGPGHGDHVRLTGGQDLLCGVHGVNGPQGDDGHMELTGLLEGLRYADVGHGGPEAAGMDPGHPLGIVHTGGDLEDVQVVLDALTDADALLDVDAALLELGAGDADLDQQALAHLGPDGVQNLDQITAAVVGGAAVLVGALVGQGGEELGQGAGVAAVD